MVDVDALVSMIGKRLLSDDVPADLREMLLGAKMALVEQNSQVSEMREGKAAIAGKFNSMVAARVENVLAVERAESSGTSIDAIINGRIAAALERVAADLRGGRA